MIEVTDTETIRHKLAGLVDQDSALDDSMREELRLLAVDFIGALPIVYGEELDRMKLWDRIASGLKAASAKCGSAADSERYINEVLVHIKASPMAVVVQEDIHRVMLAVVKWSPEQRLAWIRYIDQNLFAVLSFGRHKWESYKKEKAGDS